MVLPNYRESKLSEARCTSDINKKFIVLDNLKPFSLNNCFSSFVRRSFQAIGKSKGFHSFYVSMWIDFFPLLSHFKKRSRHETVCDFNFFLTPNMARLKIFAHVWIYDAINAHTVLNVNWRNEWPTCVLNSPKYLVWPSSLAHTYEHTQNGLPCKVEVGTDSIEKKSFMLLLQTWHEKIFTRSSIFCINSSWELIWYANVVGKSTTVFINSIKFANWFSFYRSDFQKKSLVVVSVFLMHSDTCWANRFLKFMTLCLFHPHRKCNENHRRKSKRKT